MRFHRRCGDRVTLLNENSTAVRNFVEFNHGLILSSEPLKDDVVFEVSIDRKVNVWNGSLEIGVTTLDPEFMELPATATKLRNTAWIMSGSSIVKDGVTLVNSYGPELDTLREGDCVGVMRTSKGELTFYVNDRCLGIAARDLPQRLFAVIDLYGQCVQVSIIRTNEIRPIMDGSIEQGEEDPNNDDSLTLSEMDGAGLPTEPNQYPKEPRNIYIPMTSEGACALVAQDRLRFYPRCGILVKLSNNNKTAERARPLDDYNNGVVMTHRPLYDNELFEIRIDRLVDKWSGSIEVGVTTHNPSTIRFPSTMTNMDSGTIMMSGCKVLLNGHGTCMEYGNFNLDELREGDTVGMMRRSNGKLHYFINGVDQGVATDKVDRQVWGVVDLYGMTVKVSIVDPCEDMDSNINNPPPVTVNSSPEIPSPSRFRPRIDEESLLFHTLRDSNVIIINDGKTAHRPNAFKYFNNGIVMTNRTLRTNELFQVRLDLVIPKWAGSIEIGVTQHSSNEIKFPFKMSNAKSGTWAVTGEDVIRDGAIVIPQYVRNLNRLVEGDTVGVMRKELGILHFFVNGVDQGPAAFNVPEHVFGIIDLYGRAAQATIVDQYTPPPIYSPESPLSTESNATILPEMCFHEVHGRNARLSRNHLTAWRATVYSEFNDAVLFSSRPLRECDMFELRIDKMVDCWIGSLEIGVTALRPIDLEASGGRGTVAGTATDLNWHTYILSGAAMMKDGECVRSGYPLDLDTLTVGSRVGMMWHADRSLHYYLDGMDMGKAWYMPHLNIYAVVDLYGQCTQVTILQNEERTFNYNGCTNSDNSMLSNSRALASPPPPYWSFSEYFGDNICLLQDFTVARRHLPDPLACLVFSSAHLAVGQLFEIKVVECKYAFAGSFRIGVTDINILNAHVNRSLPPTISCLPHFTAYIDGISDTSREMGTTPASPNHLGVPKTQRWLKLSEVQHRTLPTLVEQLLRYQRYIEGNGHDSGQPQPSRGTQNPEMAEVVRSPTSHATDTRRTSISDTSREMGTTPASPNHLGVPKTQRWLKLSEVQHRTLPTLVEQKVYVVLEIFGHVNKIQAVSQSTVGNVLTQQTIPNGDYQKQGTTSQAAPLEADNPEEVFEPCSVRDSCQFTSVAPRTAESTADEGDESLSEKSLSAEPSEEYLESTAGVSDSDAMVRRKMNKTPILKGRAAALAAQAAQAAEAAQAREREEARNAARYKGKGPGKKAQKAQAQAQAQAQAAAATAAASTSAADASADAGAGASTSDASGTEASGEAAADEPPAEPWPRRRNPLPYTFHNVHGGNIKLCSSDTVAVRYTGYRDGIAVISQPLRRGHNFRFRVDKVSEEWSGSVTIGAVGILPIELPWNAIHLEPPCWVLSSDLLNDNGAFTNSYMGMALDSLGEQSVLTIHFRFTSELVLQMNGKMIGCIATIPRRYSHVFPTIDLYGRICQVSVLLHPYVVSSGASLDLPVITEREELPPDPESDIEGTNSADPESRRKKKPKAFSQDNLAENRWGSAYMPAGPSHGLSFMPYRVPTPLPYRTPTPIPCPVIGPPGGPVANPLAGKMSPPPKKKGKTKKKKNKPVLPAEASLHQSLNGDSDDSLTGYNELANRYFRKSHSTHDFHHAAENIETAGPIRHTFSVGSHVGDDTSDDVVHEQFCDTNIRHNDRYPEANDVDNLDNEIMDALTMETGNLPDLTEEQTSSIENSRRDDWSEPLSVENLHYLNRILCLDVEGGEGQNVHWEWDLSGEGCEHLHLVLKYWNYLVLPYPELREAVSWGQVRCYCTNCQPDAQYPLAGWVRIERIDGVGASQRGYWHVLRSTLGSAQAIAGERGPVRRPRFHPAPSTNPRNGSLFDDVWYDEEGKPHHTVLAIEIDVEGSNAENDRVLAFLIYLRAHVLFAEDNTPSLEE